MECSECCTLDRTLSQELVVQGASHRFCRDCCKNRYVHSICRSVSYRSRVRLDAFSPLSSSSNQQKYITHHTPVSPKPAYYPLRIILLPLAKRIRQPTTNNIRNTKTNRRTPHQPSHAKLAAEALLPPSSKYQVCCAPGGCQAGAVGLEAVDVEVGAEEKDGREEHG